MFGLGKKKGEPVEKPAKKSSGKAKNSTGGVSIKSWLVNHGEKLGMGLFIGLACWFVYDGLMTKPYDRSRNPALLSTRSEAALNEIQTGDHKEKLKEINVPPDFNKVVQDARTDTVNGPYDIDHIVQSGKGMVSGEKRGDPELLAPIELQVTSFIGTIAVYSPTPSGLDKLLNAPPLGDGRRRRETPNSSTPARRLNPYFDLGFQPDGSTVFPPPAPATAPGRTVRPIAYSMVPKVAIFNAITAVVPHRDLDENYHKAFASATGFDLNRDAPNYLYYEVQRADVTGNPDKPLTDADWKDAPECMFERQLKERSTWAGICPEYVVPKYLYPDVLSMPVPPILIKDYAPYSGHSKVETADTAVSLSSGESESGGEEEASGRRRSFAIPSMIPASTDSTSSDDTTIASTEVLPQALEYSHYKLIRFFDFLGVEGVGKIYRYRIRVALEDPNYTRAESVSPQTVELKPEVYARVQAIADADRAAKEKTPAEQFRRNSKLLTPWSEPSLPVAITIPAELYAGDVHGLWVNVKAAGGKDVFIEQIAATGQVAYGEWKRDDAIIVAKSEKIERGSVLSGTPPDPGIDVVHPISKIIKWLTGFRFAQPVTIVDLQGGQPLAAERNRIRERDSLPAQGEIVAYDPRTGDLVITREFEARREFGLHTFAGETHMQGFMDVADRTNN
jgi:hypothetical protein